MRFALFLIVILATSPAWGQDRCHVAEDLLVQAREKIRGEPTPSSIGDGLQLLKRANSTCPTLGDAWYYRSLFERELRHIPLADFALGQARINGSEAMQNGANPFHLASQGDNAPLGPVRQKWALIVGINAFPHCMNVNALEFAANDAAELADVLRNPEIGRFPDANIQLLTDRSPIRPTRANIKAAMNKIARNAGPSDLVLIFIASHGTSRRNDSVGQLNYILTSDCDNMAPSLAEQEDKLWGTALPMVEISEDVRTRIKARRTVVLLDTCHSEGATGGLREVAPTKENFESLKSGAGRVIISSSRQAEVSWESMSLEHGIFTSVLINALKANPKASLSTIFNSLEKQVPAIVQNEFHEQQHPIMVRSDQGADIEIGIEATGAIAQLTSHGRIALEASNWPAAFYSRP
jgi:caspase domain-containing protein